MTRAEALLWGRNDRKRITTAAFPTEVVALVDERLGVDARSRFCVDCRSLGITTPKEIPLELDHKQALAAGGDNHCLNLEWRCRTHNRSKGKKAPSAPTRRVPWQPRRPLA